MARNGAHIGPVTTILIEKLWENRSLSIMRRMDWRIRNTSR